MKRLQIMIDEDLDDTLGRQLVPFEIGLKEFEIVFFAPIAHAVHPFKDSRLHPIAV